MGRRSGFTDITNYMHTNIIHHSTLPQMSWSQVQQQFVCWSDKIHGTCWWVHTWVGSCAVGALHSYSGGARTCHATYNYIGHTGWTSERNGHSQGLWSGRWSQDWQPVHWSKQTSGSWVEGTNEWQTSHATPHYTKGQWFQHGGRLH